MALGSLIIWVAIVTFAAGAAATAACSAGYTGINCQAKISSTQSYYVFITRGTYTGIVINDVTGGDAICQQEATAAGLSINATAWLSSEDSNAISRLSYNSGVPYTLINGAPFLPNLTTLLTSHLSLPGQTPFTNPPRITAFGDVLDPVLNGTTAWTDTYNNGSLEPTTSGSVRPAF